MEEVQAGISIQNTKNPCDKTVRGYMSSAARMWTALGGGHVQLISNPLSDKPSLHPFLQEMLSQQRAWKEPKEKREPFTVPMFLAAH